MLLLACTQAVEKPAEDVDVDSVLDVDTSVEHAPGVPQVFDPNTVHTLVLTVEDLQPLRDEPREWVHATVVFDDLTLHDVGLRLKGSSSFQPVDQKPAFKVKMDEYVPGQRLWGLERLTLNNEVWDPTMLAENMGYRTFRENGSMAPRTGYVAVTLNDRYLGLYALLESMDEGFLKQNDASGGAIWEMTRNCYFDGDCTCFEPQEGESDAIYAGCVSPEAFDLDRLVAFLAVEQAVNHPDSYSWNLNNFFVIADAEGSLSMSPWGADSTFIYAYPPSKPNPDCEPIHLDVDSRAHKGMLRTWCETDAACSSAYDAKILDIADWMEEVDLVGEMQRTRAMLDTYAPLETHVNWTLDDREARSDCFEQWTAQRPDELR